jgi:hypothetical protein
MICEKTVFLKFIGSTSSEITAYIYGIKFQIDKKKKYAQVLVVTR